MTETPQAQSALSRHWLIDALVGGGLALCLMTVANAALPRTERLSVHPKPASHAAARPTAPAAPPALIAFQDPVPGYPIISPFGLRKLPWEEGGRLHAGVDIAAPAGLPVRAAADGVVIKVASDGGYGRFVELKHAAGLTTIYAHLGRFLPEIAPGVAVKAGSPVGLVGSTGSSTGAHVHFEVRNEKDHPLNPDLFLGQRFAEADDLPLSQAARIPRGVRVAYVSNIPHARREEMQERLEAKAAAQAATAVANASAVAALGSEGATPNAADSATDASTAASLQMVNGRIVNGRLANGRPHGRFQMQN